MLTRRQLLAAGLVAPVAMACTSAPLRRGRGTSRSVQTLTAAQATTEGAGVHLVRALGNAALPMLDPFLMLDEIHSSNPDDYLAGFPRHPHRGFETVTYMLDGVMEHRDSLGNHGRLVEGSAQWMTAGHGIIHEEMPKQIAGVMHGFQLWVNLPRAQKMIAPRYQDIARDRIPTIVSERAHVRVVAGAFRGNVGPVQGIVTAPTMLDITLTRGGSLSQPLPATHNAFAYVVEGEARIGEDMTRVPRATTAVLTRGRGETSLSVSSELGARLLLFAARPINEPVARYGPFVMNTDEELRQAVLDYQSGALTRL
jgi:redox-sensitive bicupin YhaK (pirin superfamily)